MAKSETTFISPVEKPKDADTSSQASLRKQLPPHLRGIMMQQSTPSQHANASEYAPSESDFNPSSISTATTAREMKDASKPRRVSFNAWDPTGVPHRNVKSLTASSIADNSSKAPSDAGEGQTSSANFGVSGRNNWVKSKDVSICPFLCIYLLFHRNSMLRKFSRREWPKRNYAKLERATTSQRDKLVRWSIARSSITLTTFVNQTTTTRTQE